ncbi:MAG: RuBisCO large subunit C-terminal-like domain-containing protein, partial [Actinomycetota bacterium]
ERQYCVQIAFPEVNIGSQIPMLLTAAIGNISMGGKIKLVDLYLPKKFVDGFKGPRFGIAGVRKLLGVEGRPLLNNMIKPCTGYSLEVGTELFREAALGGCDIIKDDELIADASFNSCLGRVKAYMEVEKQVFEETGEHTLYTCNISDSVPKVLENAKKAVELGVNGLMINYLAVGLPVMQALAEDDSINVPILAHMDLAGAFYMPGWHGMGSHLILGKLPRLAGADIVVFPAPYGKAQVLQERFMQVARNLTFPMYNMAPAWPMPSGGVTPSMVSNAVRDLGPDIVIGTGGAIHGHPQGPRAGSQAFRQAIDAAVSGVSLEEAAKQHGELGSAVAAWQDAFKILGK